MEEAPELEGVRGRIGAEVVVEERHYVRGRSAQLLEPRHPLGQLVGPVRVVVPKRLPMAVPPNLGERGGDREIDREERLVDHGAGEAEFSEKVERFRGEPTRMTELHRHGDEGRERLMESANRAPVERQGRRQLEEERGELSGVDQRLKCPVELVQRPFRALQASRTGHLLRELRGDRNPAGVRRAHPSTDRKVGVR